MASSNRVFVVFFVMFFAVSFSGKLASAAGGTNRRLLAPAFSIPGFEGIPVFTGIPGLIPGFGSYQPNIPGLPYTFTGPNFPVGPTVPAGNIPTDPPQIAP